MKPSCNILVVNFLYDESGVMCYEYGNIGEVTKETRIYALPFLSQPLALSTQFEYDSWGRILNITYPDNEIVNYDYDLGGQLEEIYVIRALPYCFFYHKLSVHRFFIPNIFKQY